MSQSASKKKLGKSEVSLMKEYCTRASEEDLVALVELLPQTIAGDRASACTILQRDKEVDRWLAQASGADDWFAKVDGIGEQAELELQARSRKSK